MDKKMILDQIIKVIVSFFGKKAPAASAPQQPKKLEPKVEQTGQPIDWNNPKSKISEHFYVEEALELPSWGVLHVPSEDEKKEIEKIAKDVEGAISILEQILKHRVSINVHAWMRPEQANCPGSQWNGKNYNRYIYETQVWKNLSEEEKAKKVEPKSPHRTGRAIDFHVVGYEGKQKCAEIRQMLLPYLEQLNLRMEDISGGWIHLDNLPVKNKRFFKP